MERVLLFSLKNDGIKVTVQAFFDKNGDLVIEGYDIGTTVDEVFGDSDYEYSSRVDPTETKKLYKLLAVQHGNQHELLEAIQSKFNTNFCYSQFQKFLNENNITYTGFSWN